MDVHFVKIKGLICLRMINETLIILVRALLFYILGVLRVQYLDSLMESGVLIVGCEATTARICLF